MKRLGLLAILVLCLALVLPGCSFSTSTSSSSGSSGDSGSGSSGDSSGDTGEGTNRLAAADIQALIDGDLASESWVSSASNITETTLLRRPVVSITFTDETSRNDANMALQTALAATDKWGVLELSDPNITSFIIIGSIASEDPIELPASPTSAEEFVPWLNESFGTGSPAPEDWVAHVKSVEFAAALPTGFTDALVVKTDLPWDAEGKRIAEVIAQAIYTAAPTFATSYTIYYGEGDYESSGYIVPEMAMFGY